MKTVLLFDVNESLLDLRALTPHFERVFGNGDVLFEWFAQVLRSAMLTVITDQYSDFGKVGRSALDMMAQRHDVTLSDSDRSDIVGGNLTGLPLQNGPSGTGTSFEDLEIPATGEAFWYLWRADCPAGTWSSGGPAETGVRDDAP